MTRVGIMDSNALLCGLFMATFVVFAEALSPPICPCTDIPNFNETEHCPKLQREVNCEVVHDYCDCCCYCARQRGERCHVFGPRCEKGLVCSWEMFWYGTPLFGKCSAPKLKQLLAYKRF